MKRETGILPRARAFLYFSLAVFVILAARVWYLQIIRGAYYEEQSRINAVRIVPIPAPRGVIHDRNGQALVSNRLAYSISVLPRELGTGPEADAVLKRLGEISGLDVATMKKEIADSVAREPYAPVRLMRDVDPKTVIQIEESRSDLRGVFVEEIPTRHYINGDFASHLFGYLGRISKEDWERLKDRGYSPSDVIGLTGLERQYESVLRGKDGGQQVEVNRVGRPVRVLGNVDPVPGADLHLTIDYKVQKAAEEALDEELKRIRETTSYKRAFAGAAIALDPKTGAILAMASRPSFDPNAFVGGVSSTYWNQLRSNPYHPFQNRTIQGLYAPGSTFKAITLVSALENKKTTPDEIFVDNGRDRVYPEKQCWYFSSYGRVHGRQTLVEGLQNSCNTVFYELGRRVGIDELAKTARTLGFGAKAGLELFPGESMGVVPDRQWKNEYYAKGPAYDRQWYPIETLDVSIGQGALQVTPLQLADAYAGLATGGVIHRPYVVESITSSDGTFLYQHTPEILQNSSWSEDTKRIVREGLWAVVGEGTAAEAFANFPIPVAGKTGTAELPGQTTDVNALFAAFAPLDDPEIVVVAVVERGGHGGSSAAPIVRRIMEAYFGIGEAKAQAERGGERTAR